MIEICEDEEMKEELVISTEYYKMRIDKGDRRYKYETIE